MKKLKNAISNKFFLLALLTVLLPLGSGNLNPVASAAEFSTPSFGGSGGTRSYNLDCGRRGVMVGFTYKAGSWIDAIGVVCRKVNAKTGRLGEEFTRGPVGGPGGTARITKCPSGSVINAAKAQYGRFVNFFSTTCYVWDSARKRPGREYRDRNGKGVFPRPGKPCTPFCTQSDKFVCPPGKVGKALRGRYGGYIDSLRFVCDAWAR